MDARDDDPANIPRMFPWHLELIGFVAVVGLVCVMMLAGDKIMAMWFGK